MYQVIPETRNLSIVAIDIGGDKKARSCELINGDIIGWRIDVEFGDPQPIIPMRLLGWRYIGYIKEFPSGVTPCVITEYGHFNSMDDLRSELRGRGILPPVPNNPPVG